MADRKHSLPKHVLRISSAHPLIVGQQGIMIQHLSSCTWIISTAVVDSHCITRYIYNKVLFINKSQESSSYHSMSQNIRRELCLTHLRACHKSHWIHTGENSPLGWKPGLFILLGGEFLPSDKCLSGNKLFTPL
jgi:hypothetical protein